MSKFILIQGVASYRRYVPNRKNINWLADSRVNEMEQGD